MIARIEYNNTLAPVQEYGRHQTQALNKKKNKKDEGAEAADPNKKPKKNKDYDERFYDLDDGFIDDDDMEDQHLDQMMNDEFINDDQEISTSNNVATSMNVEYDPEANERKQAENEEKKYAQILKRFRVIQPNEVHRMLNESNNFLDGAKKNLTPSKRAVLNGGASPNRVDDDGATKKRKREEFENNSAHLQNLQFQGLGVNTSDSDNIVRIMKDLKDRVLKGDTMNSFKREIANISVLIDKNENQQMFEKSVYYLAQIL